MLNIPFIIVAVILMGPLAPVAKDLHVALMAFEDGDELAVAMKGAVGLTDGAQAAAGLLPGFDWVERSRLNTAIEELAGFAFAQPNRLESLAVGRLVEADWAIHGLILDEQAGTHKELILEIIDLSRGELVAETNLILAASSRSPYRIGSTDIQAVADLIRSWLPAAKSIWAKQRELPSLALLFVLPGPGTVEIPGIAEALSRALESGPNPVHPVRFERARAAGDEASLLLSGLTTRDPTNSMAVANHYCWVTYSTAEGGWKGKLYLWNSGGDAIESDLTASVSQKPGEIGKGWANQIVESLTRHVSPGNSGLPEAARSRAAQSAFALARELASNFGGNRRREPTIASWRNLVRLLETSVFLDPTNAEIREWFVRVRWGEVADSFSFDQQRYKMDRLTAWTSYYDTFGTRSRAGSIPSAFGTDRSVSEEFWNAARNWLSDCQNVRTIDVLPEVKGRIGAERFSKAQDEFAKHLPALLSEPGFQTNMPAVIYEIIMGNCLFDHSSTECAQFFSLMTRIWNVALESPSNVERIRNWPFLGQGLEIIFRKCGQSPLTATFAESLQAKASKSSTNTIQNVQAPPPDEGPRPQATRSNSLPERPIVGRTKTISKLPLPRADMLDLGREGELDMTGAAFFPPAIPQVRLTFPVRQLSGDTEDAGLRSLGGLAIAHGYLWLTSQHLRKVIDTEASSKLDRQQQTEDREIGLLWKVPLAGGTPERVKAPWDPFDLPARMVAHHGSLWLATAEHQFYVAESDKLPFKRVKIPMGSAVIVPCQIAASTNQLWSLSHHPFNFHDPNNIQELDVDGLANLPNPVLRRTILFASEQWLLIAGDMFRGYSLRERRWFPTLAPPEFSGLPSALVPTVGCDGVKDGDFWLGSDSALLELSLPTGKVEASYLPFLTIPSFPVGATYHPQTITRGRAALFNWLLSIVSSHGAPFQRHRNLVRLDGGISAMSRQGEFLWIATMRFAPRRTNSAYRVSILYTPSRRWVGSFSTPFPVQNFLFDASRVWMSGLVTVNPQNAIPLCYVDSSLPRSVPQDSWTPLLVSDAELTQRLQNIPARAANLFAVFYGLPLRVTARLESRPANQLRSDELFCLALAYGKSRLNVPERHRQYLQMLNSEYTESPYNDLAHLFERIEGVSESTRSIAEEGAGPEELLRQFDFNRDGSLHLVELWMACRAKTVRLPAIWESIDNAPGWTAEGIVDDHGFRYRFRSPGINKPQIERCYEMKPQGFDTRSVGPKPDSP